MLARNNSLALRIQHDGLSSIDNDRRPNHFLPHIEAVELVHGRIDAPVGLGEVYAVR